MNIQVKFFQNDFFDELEQEVNEFLRTIPADQVRDIKNSNIIVYDRCYYFVSIIYEEVYNGTDREATSGLRCNSSAS